MNGLTNRAADSVAPLAGDMRRVCYFRMGSQNGAGLRLGQVDGSLCTHIILESVRVDARGCLVASSSPEEAHLVQGQLNEVREFKRRHQDRVKVMVCVSNDEHEPDNNNNNNNNFSRLACSPELRQTFAKSAVEFLQQYHLDGLDLSWRFPNFPTNFWLPRDQERTGLTKIVKALRSAMVENFYDRQQHELTEMGAARPGRLMETRPPVEPHLLTVAVAGQESVLRASYELKQLGHLCDWLNVMSYDYFLFKAYAPFTGPNAPLFPLVDHYVPILNKLAFSWTATRLLDEGVDPNKIVMGIPTYARAYRLIFRNSIPAPFALSAGSRPPVGVQQHQQHQQNHNQNNQHQDNDGCLSYAQVLDILGRDETRVEFDQRARVPYLVTDAGFTWISYENPQSVREKVAHILELNLGGYMTWSLNSDDHEGAGGGVGRKQNGGHQTEPRSPANELPNNINEDHDKINGTTTTTAIDNRFPLHRAMMDELIASRLRPKSSGEPAKSRLQ